MNVEESIDLLSNMTSNTQHSGEECGMAIKKFSKWFSNLTEEERRNIVVDYFKNPPTKDDEQAIKEFKLRHYLE